MLYYIVVCLMVKTIANAFFCNMTFFNNLHIHILYDFILQTLNDDKVRKGENFKKLFLT